MVILFVVEILMNNIYTLKHLIDVFIASGSCLRGN